MPHWQDLSSFSQFYLHILMNFQLSLHFSSQLVYGVASGYFYLQATCFSPLSHSPLGMKASTFIEDCHKVTYAFLKLQLPPCNTANVCSTAEIPCCAAKSGTSFLTLLLLHCTLPSSHRDVHLRRISTAPG